MPVHQGEILDSLIQAEAYAATDDRPVELELPGGLLLGDKSDGAPSSSPEAHVGELQEATWNLVAEEKIYLSPAEIDAGLIGNNLSYEIEIWNAGEDTVSLTSVEQSSAEGFTLGLPALPIAITGETVYTFILTVLKAGPPVQDTTFTFTFDSGDVRTIELTGKRLEVFPYEVDARSAVQISLEFQTVIAQSNKNVEQRRSLTPDYTIRMEASFWFELLKTQNFLFRLRKYADMVLAVPLYCEEFALLSDPDGLDVLALDDPFAELADCWFYENAVYALLINTENPFFYELCEIESIDAGASEITVSSLVTQAFPVETTAVFPALISFCPEIKSAEHVTPDIVRYQLSFEEYKQ